MTLADTQQITDWIGRTEFARDTVSVWPALALSQALDHGDAPGLGANLLPLWHWLYFLPTHKSNELGYDGHARLGGFLPPVPLPRRMWAGGRLRFERLLRVGENAERESRIADISFKSGRSGSLGFVLVRHTIHGDQGARIVEEHDIVYRPAARADDPVIAATPAIASDTSLPLWQRDWSPDAVMLFRYSALTFNGHRIHYDRSYVTQEEGYPGLIVHGPLIATLLVDLVRRQVLGARVASFQFRAVRPTFDLHPFRLNGRPSPDGQSIDLWACDHEGWLTMQATATLA